MAEVDFIDGRPCCSACGSYKFDATFELIDPGNWKLESIYCFECGTPIDITDELEAYLRAETWTVKVQQK